MRTFRSTPSIFIAHLFLLNCALVQSAESSLWQDRKRKITESQLAYLPSSTPATAKSSAELLKEMPMVNKNMARVMSETQGDFSSDLLDSIPLSQAIVKDVHLPVSADSKKSPTVLIVQDVHLNHEAQKNIAAVLSALNEKARGLQKKEPVLVGVEGAFGAFDFESFRRIPNPTVVRELADYFLQENKIAAPSYVGVTVENPSLRFHGIDDPDSYRANVSAVQIVQKQKASIASQLKKQSNELSESKRRVLNKDLADFDSHRIAFESDQSDMGTYLGYLARVHSSLSSDEDEPLDFSIQQFLAAFEMERAIDFSRVESERKAVVEKLVLTCKEDDVKKLLAYGLAYQAGRLSFAGYYKQVKSFIERQGISLKSSPAFNDYIRYVLLADGIKPEKLFVAVSDLEKMLLVRLSRTDEERALMKESRGLFLKGRLIEFSLTHDEWAEYNLLNNVPSPGWERGRGEGNKRSASSALTLALSPRGEGTGLEAFEKFYIEADIRSEKMVSNLLSQMGEGKSTVAVMISGGFHTPQIADELRKKNIGYAVVQPKITKITDTSGTAYLSIFNREKTPLEKLIEGEKLFVNPDKLSMGAAATPAANATAFHFQAYGGARALKQGAPAFDNGVASWESPTDQSGVFNFTSDGGDYSVRTEKVESIKDGVILDGPAGPVNVARKSSLTTGLWIKVGIAIVIIASILVPLFMFGGLDLAAVKNHLPKNILIPFIFILGSVLGVTSGNMDSTDSSLFMSMSPAHSYAKGTVSVESVPSARHPLRNEDAVLNKSLPNGARIEGVFDGMGGEVGGQEASRKAREAIYLYVKENLPAFPTQEEAQQVLKMALERAQIELINHFKGEGGGTTFTVAIILPDNSVVLAWGGDARGYLKRNGKLIPLTIDNLDSQNSNGDGFSPEEIEELYEKSGQKILANVSTDEEIKNLGRIRKGILLAKFNLRNVTSNGLSGDLMQPKYRPVMTVFKAKPGDKLLLCSDGVSDNLTDNELEADQAFTAQSVVKKAIARTTEEKPKIFPDDEPQKHNRSKLDDITALIHTFGKPMEPKLKPVTPAAPAPVLVESQSVRRGDMYFAGKAGTMIVVDEGTILPGIIVMVQIGADPQSSRIWLINEAKFEKYIDGGDLIRQPKNSVKIQNERQLLSNARLLVTQSSAHGLTIKVAEKVEELNARLEIAKVEINKKLSDIRAEYEKDDERKWINNAESRLKEVLQSEMNGPTTTAAKSERWVSEKLSELNARNVFSPEQMKTMASQLVGIFSQRVSLTWGMSGLNVMLDYGSGQTIGGTSLLNEMDGLIQLNDPLFFQQQELIYRIYLDWERTFRFIDRQSENPKYAVRRKVAMDRFQKEITAKYGFKLVGSEQASPEMIIMVIYILKNLIPEAVLLSPRVQSRLAKIDLSSGRDQAARIGNYIDADKLLGVQPTVFTVIEFVETFLHEFGHVAQSDHIESGTVLADLFNHARDGSNVYSVTSLGFPGEVRQAYIHSDNEMFAETFMHILLHPLLAARGFAGFAADPDVWKGVYGYFANTVMTGSPAAQKPQSKPDVAELAKRYKNTMKDIAPNRIEQLVDPNYGERDFRPLQEKENLEEKDVRNLVAARNAIMSYKLLGNPDKDVRNQLDKYQGIIEEILISAFRSMNLVVKKNNGSYSINEKWIPGQTGPEAEVSFIQAVRSTVVSKAYKIYSDRISLEAPKPAVRVPVFTKPMPAKQIPVFKRPTEQERNRAIRIATDDWNKNKQLILVQKHKSDGGTENIHAIPLPFSKLLKGIVDGIIVVDEKDPEWPYFHFVDGADSSHIEMTTPQTQAVWLPRIERWTGTSWFGQLVARSLLTWVVAPIVELPQTLSRARRAIFTSDHFVGKYVDGRYYPALIDTAFNRFIVRASAELIFWVGAAAPFAVFAALLGVGDLSFLSSLLIALMTAPFSFTGGNILTHGLLNFSSSVIRFIFVVSISMSFQVPAGAYNAQERALVNSIELRALSSYLDKLLLTPTMGIERRNAVIRQQSVFAAAESEQEMARALARLTLVLDPKRTVEIESETGSSAPATAGPLSVYQHVLDGSQTNQAFVQRQLARTPSSATHIFYVDSDKVPEELKQYASANPNVLFFSYSQAALPSLQKILEGRGLTLDQMSSVDVRISSKARLTPNMIRYLELQKRARPDMALRMIYAVSLTQAFAIQVEIADLSRQIEFEALLQRLIRTQA